MAMFFRRWPAVSDRTVTEDDRIYTSVDEAMRDLFPNVAGREPDPFGWGVPMEDRPNFYVDIRRDVDPALDQGATDECSDS